MNESTVVIIAGRRLRAQPARLLRQYFEREVLARPRLMLACCKCEALCTIGVDCECCKNIGRSFAGSKRIRKLSPHDAFPIVDVLAALEAAA